jgi:alkanesulfonate monooxygenase SsuD/methylene tetrahydromethanopterin reductase-like flavin-dependent oxidoreductase (luciferase family)
MKRGVSVPNVGEPGAIIDLAVEVEAAGWDGFFVWDHVQVFAGAGFDVHDPWMLLAGIARATTRLRLGPTVTAPSRRRPWVLAKQIVTLDHLSHGRAVFGVGLGFPAEDEFGAFGDVTDLRTRAVRTDEALEIIDQVLRGQRVDHDGQHFQVHAELHPAAVQQPRPPIWVAVTPPFRKPLDRAKHWDGVFCNLRGEDFQPLRPTELRDYLGDFLDDPQMDVVTVPHPEHPSEEYDAMGVTWLLDMPFPGPTWIEDLRERLEPRRG